MEAAYHRRVVRRRAWVVASPLIAAGVLVAHGLAYRLTSTPTDRFHAYLEHAPQVLLLVLLAAIVLGGFGRRRSVPPAYLFPLAGATAFVLQEHLERLVHGGSFPILVTSPAFVVGLVLQVPVALVAWALARWLLDVVGDPPSQRLAVRSRFQRAVVSAPAAARAALDPPAASGRGPPGLLRSR